MRCNDPLIFCSGVASPKELLMSKVMEEEMKRSTARRKSALILEIIQDKTTVAAASRQFDLTAAEIES